MTSDSAPRHSTLHLEGGAGLDWFAASFDLVVQNVGRAVLGKDHVVRLALACMVCEGHLLLEDLPGTGKTMLARALAKSVDCSHARIQFTPDLLPSDVTGITIYEQDRGRFMFHPGPVFHSLVLADEINRASPKTQSALLEVMEEAHVTVDGQPHAVPRPFMVIATQNPVEQAGTYPLPEAQLDRFLMKASVGYPDAAATEEMLTDSRVRDRAEGLRPVLSGADVMQMADIADRVYVDPALVTYVRQLVEASRTAPEVRVGVSPRGSLAWVRVAKAWAASRGRGHVVPEDVITVAHEVVGHRLVLTPEAQFGGVRVTDVVDALLDRVAAPRDRA